MNPSPFRIAFTADFYDDENRLRYPDIGLSVFDGASHIEIRRFTRHSPAITPDQIDDVRGVIVLTPRVTSDSLVGSERLLAVGRFGVGYDTVDVRACTAAEVLVFITPGAVDRSVAEATVGWMLALTHQVRAKDRLVRTGNWSDRSRYLGKELRGRTLGLVGLGGIGKALTRLLEGFGMNRPLAFDPFVSTERAGQLGVSMVALPTLLERADFVSIHCPLNDETRGLIDAPELARMQPGAYLINTARGGIVHEDALYDALAHGRIAGAAIDCFVDEPITRPHRFGELENVLLAPHCIAHTAELFRDIGSMVCRGMLDLSLGKRPIGVVNPELFDSDVFRQKWRRLTNTPND